MAIQDRGALILDALSILADVPQHPKQPMIPDGIHMRLFPGPNSGFPKGGYYVFRRPISEPAPSGLTCVVAEFQQYAITWVTGMVSIASDFGVFAIEGPFSGGFSTLPPAPPTTTVFGGFALGGRPHSLTLGAGQTTSYARMSLNIHPGGSATVVGTLNTPSGTTTVYTHTKSGAPASPSGPIVNWALVATGKVNKITITSTATDLTEICCAPVASNAAARLSMAPQTMMPGIGWDAIPSLTMPIKLPLVHPQYPASAGAESITAAKAIATAQQRFRYGLWSDAFNSASRTPGLGTITLTNGSPIATGSATNWTTDLIGKMVCIPAGGTDYTAYAVMSVLGSDRIVLSRAYSGATVTNVAYALLAGDDFAELHDRVACLVQSSAGMRGATSPPALDAGTVAGNRFVKISATSPTSVQGTGTQWTSALAGMTIEIGPSKLGPAYFSGTTVYGIQSVESATQLTLDRPFAGPMSTFQQMKADFRITAVPSAAVNASVAAADFKPMDLLELACLMPAYAQALGLYVVDTAVMSGGVYDYIALADHGNVFGLQAANALAWLNGTPDFSGAVDAYVLTGVKHAGTPALAAPTQLEVFRLPSSGARISLAHPNRADSDPAITVKDAASWPVAAPGVRSPVMLNLWRQSRGTNAAQLSPVADMSAYADIGKIVPAASSSNPAQLPPGWPTVPIHFIDSGADGTGLDVGFYTYRATAIDEYGRWSPISPPISWTVVPPASPATIDAVHLEDRVPPPPPAGVLAWALDEADPYLVRDAVYKAWKTSFASNPPPAGLRVAWRWPWTFRNQGPDLREFRIYLQSTPLNARTGCVTSVATIAGDPGHSIVTLALDVDDMSGVNAVYTGASLHAGDKSFPITAVQPTNDLKLLKLTVRNGGPLGNQPPDSAVDGAVVIPEVHALHKKLLDPLNWRNGWIAAVPESIAGTRYDVELVHDATTNAGLQGSGATLNAATQVLALNQNVDLTNVVVGQDFVYLATTGATPADLQYFHLIVAVDPVARTLTLTLPPTSGPIIGPTTLPTSTLTMSVVSPPLKIVRPLGGLAARSAAPDPAAAAPAPPPPAAGLAWKIGSPVRYYEVILPNPAVPAIETPANLNIAALLVPTLAQPIAHGSVGVSSADWRDEVSDLLAPARNRKGNESFLAAPAPVFRVRRDLPSPPSYTYGLSLYATRADYSGKSFFTVRWNKPATGHFALVFRAMDSSLAAAHWNPTSPIVAPQSGGPPGLPNALAKFAALKSQDDYAGAVRLYQGLDDATIAWLAAQPQLRAAFMQITVTPLDCSDPANQDRRGPDDDAAYVPSASVCAYIDALDGRSTNRFFYQVLLSDAAQNRGPLGALTPPVHLPKVVPPKAPVLTKVIGDEGKVRLRWLPSRETDVTAYRVYRADSAARASDIRAMDAVAQLPVSSLQPSAQNDVSWADVTAPVGTESFYRITAVDSQTPPNESSPSNVGAARAVDTAPPPQPSVTGAWIALPTGKAPQIVVTTQAAICDVFRRDGDDTLWHPVTVPSQDAPGTKTFVDAGAPLATPLAYRAVARNRARIASAAAVLTLGPG